MVQRQLSATEMSHEDSALYTDGYKAFAYPSCTPAQTLIHSASTSTHLHGDKPYVYTSESECRHKELKVINQLAA